MGGGGAERSGIIPRRMTTVAVVTKNGFAAIAADSLTSFGDTRLTGEMAIGKEKILAVDSVHIGLAGSAAHNAVLRSYFSKKQNPRRFGSRAEIFETWRRMHRALKEDYFLNPKDEDSDPYENTQIAALLATPDGIFGVFSLRDVYQYRRYWAIGSGRDFALGALGALYDRLDTAEEIARQAVEVACAMDKSSSLPVEARAVRLRKR